MDAWARSKLAEVVGSDGADSTTAPSRQMPVPTIAIENKPPPEKESRRLQTYGRTNTGLPPVQDAGAAAQKNQPPRGMEFLPKLASTENDHMTTSTQGRPPLQELIKTAMEGAASKIDVSLEAARQIANGGGTPPQREKTAAVKSEHLPTELIHKLAAAAHYGATQLNPKLADANFPTHTSTGPGEGPNALGVMAATAEGDGVMEAGQSGHATAPNLQPQNPKQQKDPTRVADPGTGLETNDSMEHGEQPVEPIANEKTTLSNEGDKAASARYVNNLIATGLLKTAATPQGIVLVPANELVKQAFMPPSAPGLGALGGAIQAGEGHRLEGAARGAVGGITAPVGAALGGAGGAVKGTAKGALKGGLVGGLGGAAAGGLAGGGLGALGGAALGHLTGMGAGTGALYGAGAGALGGAALGGTAGAALGSNVGAVGGGLKGAYQGAVGGGQRGWDLAMGPYAKQASVNKAIIKKAAAHMVKAAQGATGDAPYTSQEQAMMTRGMLGGGIGGVLGPIGAGIGGRIAEEGAGWPAAAGSLAGGLGGVALSGGNPERVAALARAGSVLGGGAGGYLGARSKVKGKREQAAAEEERTRAAVEAALAKQGSVLARNLMVLGLYKQAEDAINPAQISAGKADATGATPPHGASPSEEGVPSEPSDVQAQKRKMISSNQAAIDYTKRDAKGDPKSDVGDVLREPAQTKSTDSVLQQALDHTDQAGAKISSADMTRLAGARAVLQKIASAHQPKKTKKSMVPGMGGGASPAPQPNLPSTPSQSSGFSAPTQS